MYPLIAKKIHGEPWLILPSQFEAIEKGFEQFIISGGNSKRIEGAGLQMSFFDTAQSLDLERPESGSRVWTKGSLAIMPVYGIIGSHLSGMESMCGGYDIKQFSRDLDLIKSNSKIKNVLTDFNSPGGQVTGIEEAAIEYKNLGKIKDTFSFTDGMSASASVWLSSQANHVLATNSSQVGGVGVYMSVLDKTKQFEKNGISVDVIKAGRMKGMGISGTQLSDESRQHLQNQVDMIYKTFTDSITASRPLVSMESMQGQVFYGKQAKDLHLIDNLVSSFSGLVKSLI